MLALLSNAGNIAKLAAFAAIALLIAGAIWYVSHLRGEVADLTQANVSLTASVAVANAAAAQSAKSAEAIAKAGADSAAIVAETHQATESFAAKIAAVNREIALAPLSDKTCPAAGGLPPALLRAADELFDAGQAGGSAGGANGQN